MIAQSNQYIAVLDTCVLAPMPLCDTLLRLAEDPAFYIPKWSADIMRELRSTLQRMGYTPAQAERRIVAMESAFEALAHVARRQTQIHPHAGWQVDHARKTSSTARKVAVSTPLPMRSRSPVANTSSSTASAVRSCRRAPLSTKANRTGPLSWSRLRQA